MTGRDAIFDLCVMIVEEECYLDNGNAKSPIFKTGLAIRDRIRCAQRNPDPTRRETIREIVYANAETTLIGFRHELGDRNVEFICDQISRKVELAFSPKDTT